MSEINSLEQNTDNETVTLIALPLHLFQQAGNNPFVVDQNILFKSLPDGSLILDTNQLINGTETISLVTNDQENNLTNEKKKDVPSPTNTQKTKTPSKSSSFPDRSKPKVRYINCKPSETVVRRRPGRPPKIKPGEKGPFKCRYCDKEFEKWVQFKRHENAHFNEKKYKCGDCNASFNILTNYLLHTATHTTKDPTCPECGKKFQRIASLKAHLTYHEKEETFYCQDCDITFNSEVELNNHIKDHSSEKKSNVNPLQCRFCQYKFTIQSDYKKHMSEHNKMRSILHVSQRKKPRKNLTSDRRHTCSQCKKNFQKYSQLERHIRVHSGEKPFVCIVCNRGFSQKGTLQMHMAKHNGVRPHKCSLCPAKFSQKGNLRAHILKTHSVPRPGENVYSCTECTCVFRKVGSLNGHMTRNHPETKGEDIKSMISQLVAMQNNLSVDKDILQQAILRSELSDVQNEEKNPNISASYSTFADLGLDGAMRRYIIKQRKAGDIRWHQCTFCCKEFRKPSDLVRHIRVHTREKPFKCKMCTRSFAVKSTLTSHIRTHSGAKDFKCKICAKIFMSLSTLNVHLRVHMGQKPHTCLMCNKSFRSISALKQHLRQHIASDDMVTTKLSDLDITLQEPIIVTNKGLQTVDVPLKKRPLTEAGAKNRPYCCFVCGACFRKLSHLKQHRVMHSGERPFRCLQCHRNLTSSGALKAHLLTHNGTKPYTCPMCNKKFTTNGSLRRHLDSHSTTRPVICPYCFKNFKTVVTCRKHIKTHKGETAHESKESDFPPKINDFPYPPDLEDALADDTFNLTSIDNDSSIQNVGGTTQTLQADASGTVILPIIPNQANLTQENIREIEDTLNNQMLNIIGNENFVDASVYASKVGNAIISTDELVNTLTGNEDAKNVDDNQLLYQTVFVNFPVGDSAQNFDGNFDVNNLVLSQLKFQNDSLFLTDLSTINLGDTNVLLPFQLTAQIDSQQNELMITPSDLEQNNIRPVIDTINNQIETLDPNIQLKLGNSNLFMPVTETNIILQNEPIQNDSNFMNSEENIGNNIQNITIVTNDRVVNESDEDRSEPIERQMPLIPIVAIHDLPVLNTPICNVCKLQFKTERQLKTHQCINLINVDDIVDNDENIKKINKISNDQSIALSTITPEGKKETNLIATTNNQEKEAPAKPEEKSHCVYKNKCYYCPKSFKKPSDLQRHIRTHTGERPFKCKECAKCFSLKSTLEGHQKIHQGKKDCVCPVCNALFSSNSSLKVHMRLHTGSRPFKCNLCSVKFRTSGHRKAHLLVHYKEAFKTGKIPEEIITRKAKMSTIIDAAVQEITEKNTEYPANQKINLETIHEQFEQFNTSDTLIIDADNSVLHFAITQEEQNNIMNINPTNIFTIENGQKHEILDEKTRQHIVNIFSKNVSESEKKKPMKICEVCRKEFSSKYFLERHMKIHTGERTFSCEFCSKKFNQKSTLESHKRVHMGSRPYSCPYCSNTFSQRGNLKTHIKRIHFINIIQTQNSSENNELNSVFLNIIQSETQSS